MARRVRSPANRLASEMPDTSALPDSKHRRQFTILRGHNVGEHRPSQKPADATGGDFTGTWAKVTVMMKVNEAPAGAARGRDRCSYRLAGQSIEAPTLGPGLYVVATPIGNLRDVTLRALEVLAAADLIACEDTRVTRKLTDHFGISTPLTAYHDHNAATARPKILDRLAHGDRIALV